MSGKEDMLQEWLQNHPAPSWRAVAWALYRFRGGRLTEHQVLKQLYGKHVTGMWSCTVILGIVLIIIFPFNMFYKSLGTVGDIMY